MTKRLKDELCKMKYENQPMKFNVISLVLIFICVFSIICATFFNIPFDYSFILSKPVGTAVYNYIPQVPVVMLIASLLGSRLGCVSALLYIIVGFSFPIFALGGGIQYILEPGFGYIISYIPAVIVAGLILKKNFCSIQLLKAALACTLIIHILGLVYALLVMILNHNIFGNVVEFVLMQSSVKLLIDFLFCTIAAYMGYCVKKVLWIVIG